MTNVNFSTLIFRWNCCCKCEKIPFSVWAKFKSSAQWIEQRHQENEFNSSSCNRFFLKTSYGFKQKAFAV